MLRICDMYHRKVTFRVTFLVKSQLWEGSAGVPTPSCHVVESRSLRSDLEPKLCWAPVPAICHSHSAGSEA